jgi:hypothetical protein
LKQLLLLSSNFREFHMISRTLIVALFAAAACSGASYAQDAATPPAAAPELAAPTDPVTPPAAEPTKTADAKDKMVCTDEQVTGSRLPHRVCLRQSDRDLMRQQAQQSMSDMHMRTPAHGGN